MVRTATRHEHYVDFYELLDCWFSRHTPSMCQQHFIKRTLGVGLVIRLGEDRLLCFACFSFVFQVITCRFRSMLREKLHGRGQASE